MVIAVFRGVIGATHHGIRVREVWLGEREADLRVELVDPPPGQMVTFLATYPYEVIAVTRANIPARIERARMINAHTGDSLAHARL